MSRVTVTTGPTAGSFAPAPSRSRHAELASWPRTLALRFRARSTERAQRAFLRTTAATFLLGLALMYAFSWYANPWGNFGTTGYHVLGDARRAKTEYLDSLPPEALPQALVLGSSNTMRYLPATIERHLGLRAFNYGVFWGKAEDLLCITRHVVYDLRHRPKLLLVGVDPWTFAPPGDEHPIFPGIRRRLLNTPQLIRHLPEINPVAIRWARCIDVFSSQQLRLSWRLMRNPEVQRTTRASMIESTAIDVDGTRLYYGDVFGDGGNVFEAVEAGTYRISERLRGIVEAGELDKLDPYIRIYNIEKFWDRRVGYMRQLLDLCRNEGVEVVFAINPVHPIFFDVLSRRTPHVRNLEKLRSLLDEFEREYAVVLGTFDASQVSNFGGDPDGFYDTMHPATRNCDLIIGKIAELVRSR